MTKGKVLFLFLLLLFVTGIYAQQQNANVFGTGEKYFSGVLYKDVSGKQSLIISSIIKDPVILFKELAPQGSQELWSGRGYAIDGKVIWIDEGSPYRTVTKKLVGIAIQNLKDFLASQGINVKNDYFTDDTKFFTFDEENPHQNESLQAIYKFRQAYDLDCMQLIVLNLALVSKGYSYTGVDSKREFYLAELQQTAQALIDMYESAIIISPELNTDTYKTAKLFLERLVKKDIPLGDSYWDLREFVNHCDNALLSLTEERQNDSKSFGEETSIINFGPLKPNSSTDDESLQLIISDMKTVALKGTGLSLAVKNNPQIYTKQALRALINKALTTNRIEDARSLLSQVESLISIAGWNDDEELVSLFDDAKSELRIRPQELLLLNLQLLYTSDKLKDDNNASFERSKMYLLAFDKQHLKDPKNLRLLSVLSLETLSLIMKKYDAKMTDPQISLAVFGNAACNYENSLLAQASKLEPSIVRGKLILFRLAVLCNNDFVVVGNNEKIPIEKFFENHKELALFFIGERLTENYSIGKITIEDFMKYESSGKIISLSKGLERYKNIEALIVK